MADVAQPQPESVAAPAPGTKSWSLAQKILFRFAFCYLVLYCAPNFLSFVRWVGRLVPPYLSLWHGITQWTARTVFHLSGRAATYVLTGSGDTTLDYIQVLWYFALALAATMLWSILDRKRRDYRRLDTWLRLLVRYTLSFILFGYGFAKIFPLQFQPTQLARFNQPYGDFSPMGVLWSFMGASMPYTVFAGICEAVPATLLLFRRTATLGALAAAGVLLNVFMLNMCYDVPVKLYSFHLLLMAVFLAAPEFRRFANVFVLNRTAEPSSAPRIRFERRWARIAAAVFQFLFVGYFLFGQISGGWKQYQETYVHPNRPPLYGLYRVESFLTNGKETGASQNPAWRWLSAEFPAALTVQYLEGLPRYYAVQYDTAARRVTLTVRRTKYPLAWSWPDPDHLLLEGKLENDMLSVRLRKIDPSHFLLASRGFHWINEFPFNR
jgi:hypothetical protein